MENPCMLNNLDLVYVSGLISSETSGVLINPLKDDLGA